MTRENTENAVALKQSNRFKTRGQGDSLVNATRQRARFPLGTSPNRGYKGDLILLNQLFSFSTLLLPFLTHKQS
jgi:hypothetical protein